MRRFPPIALAVGLLLSSAIVRADPADAPQPAAIISRIKRVPVTSTALAAVGYSRKLRALEIEFRNGAVYRYLDAGPDLHRALMDAPSKARFYDENIRRRYRSLRVRRRILE